jgi:ATPase subunit of ABC transporter with duplicated ATPase domains
MAKMLFDPPNVLALDEPTNHLDIGAKAMLIASHDRHLLAAPSNHVLELTPDGVQEGVGLQT